MRQIEAELDRYLEHLSLLMRRRGYSQLEIQQALGWGRSYISQLVKKHKSLRMEQLLLILRVIGVDPAEFFGRVYEWPGIPPLLSRFAPASADPEPSEEPQGQLAELSGLIRGLVRLLAEKGLVDGVELSAAAAAERGR